LEVDRQCGTILVFDLASGGSVRMSYFDPNQEPNILNRLAKAVANLYCPRKKIGEAEAAPFL
jgi:hypothetical protein